MQAILELGKIGPHGGFGQLELRFFLRERFDRVHGEGGPRMPTLRQKVPRLGLQLLVRSAF